MFLNPCSTIITTMFSDNNHSTKLHSDNPLSLDTYLSFTLLLETPCFLHKKTLKYGLCSTQTWRNINVNSNALYNPYFVSTQSLTTITKWNTLITCKDLHKYTEWQFSCVQLLDQWLLTQKSTTISFVFNALWSYLTNSKILYMKWRQGFQGYVEKQYWHLSFRKTMIILFILL